MRRGVAKSAGALFGAAVSSSSHFLKRSSLPRNNYKITLAAATILPALFWIFCLQPQHAKLLYFAEPAAAKRAREKRFHYGGDFHSVCTSMCVTSSVCMWKSERVSVAATVAAAAGGIYSATKWRSSQINKTEFALWFMTWNKHIVDSAGSLLRTSHNPWHPQKVYFALWWYDLIRKKRTAEIYGWKIFTSERETDTEM